MTKVYNENAAFGHPGIHARWTHGCKDGVGTTYASSSHIWFTLWNGIITGVYYPTVDRPQLRKLVPEMEFVDIPMTAAQRAPIRFTFFWPGSNAWGRARLRG